MLTCWVKEIVLTNIPENPDIVMHKDAGHTWIDLLLYSSERNPIKKQWDYAQQIRRSTHCSIDALFSIIIL